MAIDTSSVVGTWTAVPPVFGTQGIFAHVQQAVLQLMPNGTFIEGYAIDGNAAAFSGRYTYDPKSQIINYIIDNAGPATGPVPDPFQIKAQSSTVFFTSTGTEVTLNNDLLFTLKSASVVLSDFVLPPPPAAKPPISGPPTGVRAAIASMDVSHPPVLPWHL